MKLFRDLLQMEGYTTLEATNGQKCLETLKMQKPDLILMDLQMPVMDGRAATQILKSDPATRDIPVVALTALAMSGDRGNSLEAGCDDYISKPIDVDSFLKKVAEYV